MVRLSPTICAVTLATILGVSGLVIPQTPQPVAAAERGVRCPAQFTSAWDPTSKVLRCRRDVVSWVVTTCADKSFATYLVRPGADACGPTEIPGVGTPPGMKGTRAVTCAAPGYEVMIDRTADRDRCEKTERIFALPLPAG